MKRLLLPFLIVFAVKAHPQNYQLLYSQQERLYGMFGTNSAGVAILDVEYIDGDSVFYLNHNWVSGLDDGWGCHYADGPSIFGSHMAMGQDGSWTLYNAAEEPITIVSQANVGESWLAWSNTAATSHVEASVLGIATESILGTAQNVKTIQLQALDENMEAIASHPINNVQIKIAENLGLLRCPEIPNFPFSNPHNLTGIQGMAGQQNITWRQVFDYEVGDEIHNESGTSSYGDVIIHQYIRTILSRDDYPDSTVYSMEVQEFFYEGVSTQIDPQLINTEIVESVVKANPEFDPLALSPVMHAYSDEDFVSGSYFYSDYDNDLERNTKWRDNGAENMFHQLPDGEPLCFYETIDWGMACSFMSSPQTYYEGIGGPFFTCTGLGPKSSWNELRYFNLQGETWGQPLSTSVFDRLSANGLKLYPNPASSEVRIDLNDHMLPAVVQILDTHGRVLLSERIAVSDYLLSRQGIAAGLYHVRLIPANGQPLSAKLMWQH